MELILLIITMLPGIWKRVVGSVACEDLGNLVVGANREVEVTT
ncbi:MAG: hypothetical protein N3D82_00110 [Ignisphaera sp.]|nr:hypothetical protein [Ignisphaera sp.]MCX8167420.1 hypothetical protein [Ignisphaera sp.]MDW8085924.1 hypothetical protein [Ignisphaera sp.]